MIAEILQTGPADALSAKEIAGVLGITTRDVTRQIEQERAKGAPICASCGYNPGYYLAPDRETMQAYCERLKHRGNAIKNTMKHCQKTAGKLPSREDIALHL